jgi:hypothetical protein
VEKPNPIITDGWAYTCPDFRSAGFGSRCPFRSLLQVSDWSVTGQRPVADRKKGHSDLESFFWSPKMGTGLKTEDRQYEEFSDLWDFQRILSQLKMLNSRNTFAIKR